MERSLDVKLDYQSTLGSVESNSTRGNPYYQGASQHAGYDTQRLGLCVSVTRRPTDLEDTT